MFTCYYYKNILLFLLIKLNFRLYNLKLFYFITTNLSDVFSVCLKLSYFISFQFTILLIIYHITMFFSPGLFKFEYNLLKLTIFVCFILFIIGIAILHLFVLPFLWDFFLALQSTCKIQIFFESKITEYFDFYLEIYMLVILITQICSIILLNLLLVKNKIVFIINYRKFVYVSFILISTLITPPDVVSQILVSTCLVLFYELIVFSVLLQKHVKT